MEKKTRLKRERLKEVLWFLSFKAIACGVAVFLFLFLLILIVKGAGGISWEFLTQVPKEGMTRGGILPAIIGTLWLGIGSVILAFPMGVALGIYLSYYASENLFTRILRLSINNLAGTPSIVFGLFGLAVFVKAFGFGVSILSGILTLGLMVLPIIVRSTEEALRAVPKEFIEASFGLGATKFQTIWHVALPTAFGWILTGVILSLSRAAGETAPILFTAASFYMTRLPSSPFSETMALPFHIYALMTEGTNPEIHTKMAFGATLVLLFIVMCLSVLAIIERQRFRKGKRW